MAPCRCARKCKQFWRLYVHHGFGWFANLTGGPWRFFRSQWGDGRLNGNAEHGTRGFRRGRTCAWRRISQLPCGARRRPRVFSQMVQEHEQRIFQIDRLGRRRYFRCKSGPDLARRAVALALCPTRNLASLQRYTCDVRDGTATCLWRITELAKIGRLGGFDIVSGMRDVVILFIHLIVTVVRLGLAEGCVPSLPSPCSSDILNSATSLIQRQGLNHQIRPLRRKTAVRLREITERCSRRLCC